MVDHADKQKRIILIDGNSLLYRAFFALPTSLATKTGQVTNSIYGFTTMLLKLVDDRKPAAIAVAFDKGRTTFRHAQLKTYKANRPKMPDELVSQVPIIKEMLDAMDIPSFELEGYEADDLLATMAAKAESAGYKVDIVTGDKDALQLVSANVSVITTKKGISEIKVFEPPDVVEAYGVEPDNIRDWLALKGDASDNIPGVPGIGDKTATLLLREYGNIESLLKHLEGVKSNKIRSALESHKAEIEQAKDLVTLIKDVDIELDFEQARLKAWSKDKMGPLLRALEFNSLYDRLFAGSEAQPTLFDIEASAPEPKRLLSVAQQESFHEAIKGAEYIAVDLFSDETTWMFAFEGEAYSIRFDEASRTIIEAFLSIPAVKIVHDNKRLHHACHRLSLSWPGQKFDVMLAAYIDDPTNGRYGLSDLGLRYLQRTVPEAGTDQTGSAVLAIALLHPKLRMILDQHESLELLDKVEMPLSEVLGDIETAGVALDIQYLANLGRELTEEMNEICLKTYGLAGCDFNLNSPAQLQDILFKRLGLKGRKKTKTGLSTDIGVLTDMQTEHEIIPLIIRWRELSKLRSTYIYTLPEMVDQKDHKLHTTFNQVGTATGRLASSNPNLQNIPVRTELGLRVRRAFVAGQPEMKLIMADYSQIELRILAHMSSDENLIAAFARDEDIHARTAASVFGVTLADVDRDQRRFAKAINFGIVYGMTSFGLAKQLGIENEEAQSYIDSYFRQHPGVHQFIAETIRDAKMRGYVSTILNRRRYIPELRNDNPRIQQLGERLAVNSPLQGSAADIIKLAMINIAEALGKGGFKTEMVLQIHDELMFRVPIAEVGQARTLIIQLMENAYPLDVHLKVDVSVVDNWGEAKI